MKTLVNSAHLPEFFGSDTQLEEWLEGFHESFEPQSAIVDVLYARYSWDQALSSGVEASTPLNQPYILDIAFNPIGTITITIRFSILGIKRSHGQEEYDLIPIILREGDFDDINVKIIKAIKEKGKTGFSYPSELNVSVRYRKNKSPYLVELINDTIVEKKDYSANLYKTKISISSDQDFLPFSSNRSKLSYKYDDTSYAKSRFSSYNYDTQTKTLQTTRVPVYVESRVKRVDFGFTSTYEYLSKCPAEDLMIIPELVRKRIDLKLSALKKSSEAKKAANPSRASRIDAEFESDKKRLDAEIEKLHEGISMLQTNKDLLQAFRLLNTAFLIRSINKTKPGQKSKNEGWYPFQLTFILSALPGLFNDSATLTLLNFPTGMGKTESFLGLAVLKIIYERITKTNHGTSVIIKYPRKLLSRQQLERALEIIAFTNAAIFSEESSIFKHPVSLGTLFNSQDTPNRYIDTSTNNRVSGEFDKWVKEPYVGKAIQLEECPYCGSKIKPPRATRGDLRIKFICTNTDCIFSVYKYDKFFEHEPGELPLFIGDDEVFRYHPSILITTIDKFSSFSASNPNFKCLFLDERAKCDTKYGFYFTEKHFQNFPQCWSQKKLDKKEISAYFKPPSLFIIDEIHLVSGSYASKFSIMENAFFDLFDVKGKNPPKIICSSATLNQTFNGEIFVYQSDFSKIFRRIHPSEVVLYPSFWDVFAEETSTIGRIIKAVMPGNYSKYLATEHISELYLKNFESLSAKDKLPYATFLYYFKSKAKLERIRGSIAERVIETEKRGGRLHLTPRHMEFSTDIEQPKMTKEQAELQKKLETGKTQLDLVYATNTIANGLDIDAFNTMFVVGFPNKVSEYVQARSRIARREQPGLCILILDQFDVRETSIFYDFHDLHKNIDLVMEGNPTNSEALGVVENMIKKLFHLAVQLLFDSIDRPFYLIRTIGNILSSESDLNTVKEKVYKWFSFSNESDTVRAFFDDIWQRYIDNYKNWIRIEHPITIYDEKRGLLVPQPTLIDISHQIGIRLDHSSAYLASRLSTTVGDTESQPNEEGDDNTSGELI